MPNNTHNSDTPSNCPVILHISDFHFGIEEVEENRINNKSHSIFSHLLACVKKGNSNVIKAKKNHRNRVLNSFVDFVTRFTTDEPTWKPKYICITGDIAHSGKNSEYNEAKIWLKTLLEALDLKAEEALIVCPGNHDIDRIIADKYIRPSRVDIADSDFLGQLSILSEKFNNYCDFLKEMTISPYTVTNNDTSYLYGIKNTKDNLEFICLNSCWYSRSTDTDGRGDTNWLWLGMPLVQSLIGEGVFSEIPNPNTRTIMLVHHPERDLNEYESHSWGNRPATFRNLAKMTHVILSGHTHAHISPWDQIGQGAYISPVGMLYGSLDSLNTFRLIKLSFPDNKYIYRAFIWSSTSDNWAWRETKIEDKQWRWFQEHQNYIDETIITSHAKELSTIIGQKPSRTQDIINTLTRFDKERNYKRALEWWHKDLTACKWFADNKSHLPETLVVTVELIIEKIKLKADDNA